MPLHPVVLLTRTKNMSPQTGICGFKDSDKFKAITHPFLGAERTYAELFHEQSKYQITHNFYSSDSNTFVIVVDGDLLATKNTKYIIFFLSFLSSSQGRTPYRGYARLIPWLIKHWLKRQEQEFPSGASIGCNLQMTKSLKICF